MSDSHRDDLDTLVDSIAREMTALPPPSDLRGRITARIADTAHPRRPPARAWWLSPLVAAAVIVVAVFVAHRAPAPEPQVASSKPQVASSKEQVASSKQQAASSKEQVASSKPPVASSKEQGASSKPQAASSKPQAASLAPLVVERIDIAPI